jgi:prenyltransferase beta subunit
MNIEKAIKLINSKKTTVDDVYKFIFSDIEKFQNERENYYVQELKEQYESSDEEAVITESCSERAAERITANLERDTKIYVNEYVTLSIDALLDAYNSKQIKDKNSIKNFVSLLVQLRGVYAEEEKKTTRKV